MSARSALVEDNRAPERRQMVFRVPNGTSGTEARRTRSGPPDVETEPRALCDMTMKCKGGGDGN